MDANKSKEMNGLSEDVKNENRKILQKVLLFLQSPLYVNGLVGAISFKHSEAKTLHDEILKVLGDPSN